MQLQCLLDGRRAGLDRAHGRSLHADEADENAA